MTWIEWYDSLAKPSWTPAPATISLIWMLLYPVILVSFEFVFVRAYQGRLPRRVALPFVVNIVANLLFMPIFAGLRSVQGKRIKKPLKSKILAPFISYQNQGGNTIPSRSLMITPHRV